MNTIWIDLLGSESRFYDAGGIRTRCIEAGDGEPVIFLHGVGGHAEAFARNVVPMSQNFHAISLDCLGFGLTDRPAEPASREDYITHLLNFMDAAGIEKAHLVGESFGGWLAFWTAITHPDRVSKLISVCGAQLAVKADEQSQRHLDAGRAELRRLSQQFAAEPTRENMRARLNWLFHRPDRDVTEELVDVRLAIYQRALEQEHADTGHRPVVGPGSHGGSFTPDVLAKITQPTLMLWTEFNPSATAAMAEIASGYLPDGHFRLMEDCAHWPQWEQPERFNSIITEFLGTSGRE
jgi:2-hydroxy-6-oxonona-2,4-dienedioate hydrolase